MEQWRLKKISTQVAWEDFLACRGFRARSCVQCSDWHEATKQRISHNKLTMDILKRQEGLCRPFHGHDEFDGWQTELEKPLAFRFPTLLLLGSS